MNILVLAPLRAEADHALDDPWTRPIQFAAATFEQTMANVGPHVVLDHKTRQERHYRKLQDFADEKRPVGGAALLDDILNATEGNSNPDGIRITKALERAWRGLAFLCSHAHEGVSVFAMDAAHDTVGDVLEALARGGSSSDLIVVDHTITSSARDLERMLKWAELAEGLGAPIVCGGTPELVGMDDLAALAKSERRLRSSDDPRAVRFRSATAKDPMRWLSLALNGTANANAPHVLASLAMDAAAKTGWAAALGQIPLDADLEANATEDAAMEAAGAGLVLLHKGRVTAPVAYREPSRQGGAASPASLGLGDQLFLARVYQLVQELGGAIPAGTPSHVVTETALVALNDLFSDTNGPKPAYDVKASARGLEVTGRPRGFGGIALEEATLGAALG
jgi:hypothetical protein